MKAHYKQRPPATADAISLEMRHSVITTKLPDVPPQAGPPPTRSAGPRYTAHAGFTGSLLAHKVHFSVLSSLLLAAKLDQMLNSLQGEKPSPRLERMEVYQGNLR